LLKTGEEALPERTPRKKKRRSVCRIQVSRTNCLRRPGVLKYSGKSPTFENYGGKEGIPRKNPLHTGGEPMSKLHRG